MVEIRKYKKGDEEEIIKLWEKISGKLLGKNDIFKIDKKWWNWRVLKNPCGLPDITVAVSDDGEIVAHHMSERLVLRSGEGDKKICQGVLSMADEKHRGLPFLKLVNTVAKDLSSSKDIAYGFPNKDSQYLFEKLGWQNAGDVPVLGRPLNFFFEAFDFLRNSRKYEVKSINAFDKRLDKFLDSIKNDFDYFIKRDFNFLNWKYGGDAPKQYEKRLVIKDGKVRGYCVFRCGKFNDVKTGLIVDILADDKRGFDALVDEVLKYFKAEKMRFASCYMIKNNFFYNSLIRRGFIPVPKFLLPKRNALLLFSESKDVLNLKKWYLSYGDWDAV